MEFQFEVKEILPDRISVIESKDSILNIYGLKHDHRIEGKNWLCDTSSSSHATIRRKKENLENLIDQMGLASSRAQELSVPVTTFKKLLNSYQQRLYVIRDMEKPFSVIGMLKIGRKRLIIGNDQSPKQEVDATCVLDFYVHESRQRCGYGRELLEVMLKDQNMEPAMLAVHRPSHKFLSFLSKHYNLRDPKPQPNNFKVYQGFLDKIVGKPQEQSWDVYDAMHTYPVDKDSEKYGFNSQSTDWNDPRNRAGNLSHDDFKKKRAPDSNEHDKNESVNDAMHGNTKSHSSDRCYPRHVAEVLSDDEFKKKRAPDSNEHVRNESVNDAMHGNPKCHHSSERCYPRHMAEVLSDDDFKKKRAPDCNEHERNESVNDAMHGNPKNYSSDRCCPRLLSEAILDEGSGKKVASGTYTQKERSSPYLNELEKNWDSSVVIDGYSKK